MEQQKLIILCFTIASLFAITSAQSSTCTNEITSLSPCLAYITGSSTTPASGCCTQLGAVVKSQPQCLCQVLNGGASSYGISINKTQAMNLPTACNVKTPAISSCTSAGSPKGSTAKTPSSGTSGSSSNSVPTTMDGSSNGSATKSSFSLLVSVLFAFMFV